MLQEGCGSVEGGDHQDGRGVAREIVVLHGHLDEDEAHLANELGVLALIAAEVLGHLPLEFVRIGLIEIVVGDEIDLEIEKET